MRMEGKWEEGGWRKVRSGMIGTRGKVRSTRCRTWIDVGRRGSIICARRDARLEAAGVPEQALCPIGRVERSPIPAEAARRRILLRPNKIVEFLFRRLLQELRIAYPYPEPQSFVSDQGQSY
jgi:hypothetical protein